jgi:hypothetical protein
MFCLQDVGTTLSTFLCLPANIVGGMNVDDLQSAKIA